MQETVVIDIAQESSLPDSMRSLETAEVSLLKRQGLDGATVLTCVVTLTAALLPKLVDLLGSRMRSRETFNIEWRGMKIENVSTEKLKELEQLFNEAARSSEAKDDSKRGD